MDSSDNHEGYDSHANAFVQAESSRLEHAATLSLCPACGTMVRRLDARHCSTCGRAFAIAVDYLPADALRASYHTQQHCPPQSIKIKADKADSAGSNHLRSKTFVSAMEAQPAQYSNNASQLALAFATYALVPYLGILFCPGAIITGCIGFARVHQMPYIGGRRASLQGIIAGILILCAQLFLWWILYKVPEWAKT